MHFPDLKVYCDWSTFFPLKSADVSGAGTRDEPVRTSAWEARRGPDTYRIHRYVPLVFNSIVWHRVKISESMGLK